jgi:Domain of unknown function (DUF2828)
MSALLQALDSFTPTKSGENGHVELDWSNDIQEKIVQFDFQCVRTDTDGIATLANVLDGLLNELSTSTNTSRKELLVTLFKVIAKTRDINGGKGEYMLSYMMIWTWYKYFPILALTALQMFVMEPCKIDESLPSQEPYGSWKDIKYFCKYVLDNGATMDHPLILSCIKEINNTLLLDDHTYNRNPSEEDNAANGKNLTLVSKWIPREESDKFGFLYEALAKDYFKEFMASAKTDVSKAKALKKCKTQYRILCSKLNRHLDTVQIKQTSKNWADINHAKTTSITMAKQRKAFLNQKKSGGEARTEDPDRVQCAENLRAYLESLKKEGKEVKGKNVGLEMFGAQALGLLEYSYNSVRNQEEADILNSQWRDNCNKKNANGLGPMIAVVDTSGSMSGDPLCAALSLGCRVAEKSILGKRVMTFSAEPAWINLDGKETFTDMVGAIMQKSNTAGLNTNFYKALDLILTVIEEKRIPAEDVENMILTVFSDMQIDDNLHVMTTPGAQGYGYTESQKVQSRSKWDTMFHQIKSKYANVGMRMYGQPLNPPHILFWNLRKTNGFPTLSTEAGCSMMSGFDPTILNMFCEMGMDALKEMTPYKTLLKLLDNPRYLPMESVIRAHFIDSV